MSEGYEYQTSQPLASRLTRRRFLELCALMASALCLPPRYADRIARALAENERPPLVWLEFQDCAGNTESLLRATQPTLDDLLLEVLSVEYHETLMVPAGGIAEAMLERVLEDHDGSYFCVVEGAIPTGAGGAYCCINGRTALEIARETCRGALAVLAVGSCAYDGGLPAAEPNPTGATGVAEAVPGLDNLVCLPGCPVNVVNVTATLVHFLTFGDLPLRDETGRPNFAYGDKIHRHCERREHHDAGRFAEAWGDLGHRSGWCLRKLGCRGPQAFHNCPTERWNEGTSWPVAAGHNCIACSEAGFWDKFSPFYEPDGSVAEWLTDDSGDIEGDSEVVQ